MAAGRTVLRRTPALLLLHCGRPPWPALTCPGRCSRRRHSQPRTLRQMAARWALPSRIGAPGDPSCSFSLPPSAMPSALGASADLPTAGAMVARSRGISRRLGLRSFLARRPGSACRLLAVGRCAADQQLSSHPWRPNHVCVHAIHAIHCSLSCFAHAIDHGSLSCFGDRYLLAVTSGASRISATETAGEPFSSPTSSRCFSSASRSFCLSWQSASSFAVDPSGLGPRSVGCV